MTTAVLAGFSMGVSLLLWNSWRQDPPIRAPGLKAWRMSKWIKHNGILRTQGLCGDFSNMPSSTAQQTREALKKLDGILKDAGITRRHLLAITIFIADISHDNFEEMNSVYDKWVDPEGLPTRLCVQAKMGHRAAVEFRAEAYY
jgi:enamine deaminase RidA (YjgF/YER057c/UK114 family)